MQKPWERGTSARDPSWLYARSGHLRAVWRFLAFGACMAVAYGVLTGTVGPLMARVSVSAGDTLGSFTWLELGATAIACFIVLRLVDAQPWSSVGLGQVQWRPILLVHGVSLGGAAIAATASILLLLGALHFQPVNSPVVLDGGLATDSPVGSWCWAALRLAAILAPAALSEELIFRGYLWRIAEDAVGTRTALWSTSVAFGAAHLTNPGANARTILLVILAGVCLGVLRSRTGSLPAAWSAHFAWNWCMAALLHVPVSGLPLTAPRYQAVSTGPDWVSGGAWGPEGGAIAALVMSGALLVASRTAWTNLFLRTRIHRRRAGRASTRELTDG